MYDILWCTYFKLRRPIVDSFLAYFPFLSTLMKSSYYLFVCVSSFQSLNQLSDFHEIWHKHYANKDHSNLSIYDFLQSPIQFSKRTNFRRGSENGATCSYYRFPKFPSKKYATFLNFFFVEYKIVTFATLRKVSFGFQFDSNN